MKKIISNKLYDTDTARMVGWDDGGDGFYHWREELYQKRTGEYFLYGSGGAASRYAVCTWANEWSGGEKIIPLDLEAARKWAEAHLSAERYGEIFGLPDESAEPIALHVILPAPLVAALRQRATEAGLPQVAIIEKALTEYLK